MISSSTPISTRDEASLGRVLPVRRDLAVEALLDNRLTEIQDLGMNQRFRCSQADLWTNPKPLGLKQQFL